MTDKLSRPQLKYQKRIIATRLTGTNEDGTFRVLDDDNKSTYMYQRINKYDPRCNRLFASQDFPPTDTVIEEKKGPLLRGTKESALEIQEQKNVVDTK